MMRKNTSMDCLRSSIDISGSVAAALIVTLAAEVSIAASSVTFSTTALMVVMVIFSNVALAISVTFLKVALAISVTFLKVALATSVRFSVKAVLPSMVATGQLSR